ncbi:MAG: hypothetical protein GY898_33160 [Proteobacteria bacterium]|nr:hypothetical protein [Pseudomonadota bacterium]
MTTRHLLLPALLAASFGCYDYDEVVERPDEAVIFEDLSWDSYTLTNSLIPGALDGMNDPRAIDAFTEMTFDQLPLRAELAAVPWTDSYWPKHKGGISWRWQDDDSHTFRWLTKEEAEVASPDQIARLSPAEKYDLLVGAYDYPLAERERARNQPTEPGWAGYCHGWSPAAMIHDEPSPRTLTNADGIAIPFGSSDIKALLTYFEGEVVRTSYLGLDWAVMPAGVGSMCGGGSLRNPACHDVNPGAMHVALAHNIGLEGRGLVLEVDPTYEKWNQPTFAYDATVLASRPPSAGASEEAVEELVVVNDVRWTVEIEPEWEPQGSSVENHVTTERYLYTVELDAQREVVGGQWLLRTEANEFITMGSAWDYLKEYDGGRLTEDEISDLLRSWIKLPDFLWSQPPGEFPAEFEPVSSNWEILGGGLGSRRALYGYFGRLPALID